MKPYKYRPVCFYLTCFAATWAFWIAAAILSKSPHDNGVTFVLMTFGLIAPAVTAVFVLINREMFFEKEHIGNLLNYKEDRRINE